MIGAVGLGAHGLNDGDTEGHPEALFRLRGEGGTQLLDFFFWTLSWPVIFSLRSLLFEKKILSMSINMACLVCYRTAGPTKSCFLPETELKTMLSWPHCSVDRHQEIPLPALPSSIIP